MNIELFNRCKEMSFEKRLEILISLQSLYIQSWEEYKNIDIEDLEAIDTDELSEEELEELEELETEQIKQERLILLKNDLANKIKDPDFLAVFSTFKHFLRTDQVRPSYLKLIANSSILKAKFQ